MYKYLIGIEWFNQYLKLVCLEKRGNDYYLYRVDKLTIPSAEFGEISKILSRWIGENSIDKNQSGVVLTLPESLIFLKELELPKVKDRGLSEAIFWEISSAVPFSPNEAVIQWKIISEGQKSVHLSAIVVKNQVVQSLFSAIWGAGLSLLAIEPSSLAFSRLYKGAMSAATLLVVTEDEETNFILLKKNTPIFSTSQTVSLSGMRTKRKKLDKELTSVLASSAKKVISYWETKGEEKIRQVVITGMGTRYYGLASAINNLIHLPTVFAKVGKFQQINIPAVRKRSLERFLVPLGAAARLTLRDSFEEINLLPQKERQSLISRESQRKTGEKILFFAKITFILLIINLLLFTGLKFWRIRLTKEIGQTKIFVSNHPAQKFTGEVKATNKLLSQVDFLINNQKDTGARLRQISQLTPDTVQFTALTFTNSQKEEWKIAGKGDREAILAFYEKIKSDAGAKEVSMPYSNLQKAKDASFTILIIW